LRYRRVLLSAWLTAQDPLHNEPSGPGTYH